MLVVRQVMRNFEHVSHNSVVLAGWQLQRCAYFVKTYWTSDFYTRLHAFYALISSLPSIIRRQFLWGFHISAWSRLSERRVLANLARKWFANKSWTLEYMPLKWDWETSFWSHLLTFQRSKNLPRSPHKFVSVPEQRSPSLSLLWGGWANGPATL